MNPWLWVNSLCLLALSLPQRLHVCIHALMDFMFSQLLSFRMDEIAMNFVLSVASLQNASGLMLAMLFLAQTMAQSRRADRQPMSEKGLRSCAFPESVQTTCATEVPPYYQGGPEPAPPQAPAAQWWWMRQYHSSHPGRPIAGHSSPALPVIHSP